MKPREAFTIIAWSQLPDLWGLRHCPNWKPPRVHNRQEGTAYGRQFLDGVSAGDVTPCHFHTPPMTDVCKLAVAALRETAELDEQLLQAVALRDGHGGEVLARAIQVLTEPVLFEPNYGYIARAYFACPMIAARVPECPVEISQPDS